MFVCPSDMARLLISRCRPRPPSTFQTLSVLLHKVRPATDTFRFPRAAFVIDKALHSGLLCCIGKERVFSRCDFFV